MRKITTLICCLLISVGTAGADDLDASRVARFQVAAKRFLVHVQREVTVRVTSHGTRVDVRIDLDRPVPAAPGSGNLQFRIHVLDEKMNEVDRIEKQLPAGKRTFDFSLDLPRGGFYRLVMTDDDIEAGKARIHILPDGEASVEFVVSDRVDPDATGRRSGRRRREPTYNPAYPIPGWIFKDPQGACYEQP